MIHYEFIPQHVCSTKIYVDLSDDGQTIEHVAFDGGCKGNLKAICKLVAGRPTDDIVGLLAGNTCGFRSTSCADQMCIAFREAQQLVQPAVRVPSSTVGPLIPDPAAPSA